MVSPSTQFDRSGIYVPHRISGCFEFSQHFSANQVTGRVDAISPEAGGFVSLIGVFP